MAKRKKRTTRGRTYSTVRTRTVKGRGVRHDCRFGGYHMDGMKGKYVLPSEELNKVVRRHTFTCELAKTRWHCRLRR